MPQCSRAERRQRAGRAENRTKLIGARGSSRRQRYLDDHGWQRGSADIHLRGLRDELGQRDEDRIGSHRLRRMAVVEHRPGRVELSPAGPTTIRTLTTSEVCRVNLLWTLSSGP
jgi:hypothetical protein